MISQLIEIISKEARLFESFLALLEEQKEALVTNDVERLSEVTGNQQEMLVKSRILNRERERIVRLLRSVNNLSDDIDVSQLLDLADEDQAARLTHLRELILSLHDQINETRNSNALLINQSREFINRTLTMLSQMNRPEGAYGRNGTVTDCADTILLDRRI